MLITRIPVHGLFPRPYGLVWAFTVCSLFVLVLF